MVTAKPCQRDEESAVLARGLTALAKLLATTLVGADRDGPSDTPDDPVTEVGSELTTQVRPVPASEPPSEIETDRESE